MKIASLNSNFNFDSCMQHPFQYHIGNLQYHMSNIQNCQMCNSSSNLQNVMINNDASQNWLIPNKLVKTSLYISSSNLPEQIKDNLIQNLLFSNTNVQNIQFNQCMIPQVNQHQRMNIGQSHSFNSFFNADVNISNQSLRTSNNARVLFKKEEDEKIKKLVSIFGTRHWDLVAQFMEGRTAKQCRDRYSNYLMPGFFQGEWSDEEDKLLVKLYEENGPRWSIIKKSFQNRSANNIKNRWYYFLRKKVQENEEQEINNEHENENSSNLANKSNLNESELLSTEENQLIPECVKIDEVENDENQNIHQENEFFDYFNNIDIEESLPFFN